MDQQDRKNRRLRFLQKRSSGVVVFRLKHGDANFCRTHHVCARNFFRLIGITTRERLEQLIVLFDAFSGPSLVRQRGIGKAANPIMDLSHEIQQQPVPAGARDALVKFNIQFCHEPVIALLAGLFHFPIEPGKMINVRWQTALRRQSCRQAVNYLAHRIDLEDFFAIHSADNVSTSRRTLRQVFRLEPQDGLAHGRSAAIEASSKLEFAQPFAGRQDAGENCLAKRGIDGVGGDGIIFMPSPKLHQFDSRRQLSCGVARSSLDFTYLRHASVYNSMASHTLRSPFRQAAGQIMMAKSS